MRSGQGRAARPGLPPGLWGTGVSCGRVPCSLLPAQRAGGGIAPVSREGSENWSLWEKARKC